MSRPYALLLYLLAALLIVGGSVYLVLDESARYAGSMIVSGLSLLLMLLVNGGRRLFSDTEESDGSDISKTLTALMFGRLRHYAIFREVGPLREKSALEQNMEAREAKMHMLRERIAAREARASEDE
ncbi:MAG: hypothetical protein AAF683_11765 [Pseudomonadota bacterium]